LTRIGDAALDRRCLCQRRWPARTLKTQQILCIDLILYTSFESFAPAISTLCHDSIGKSAVLHRLGGNQCRHHRQA
jgi:hypothetical protein